MKAIQFSSSELQFISRYDGVSHAQWNSLEDPVATLRKEVRNHCLVAQKFRCAYCRMEKKESHGMTWDVDHVIPKALYPRYLYEPHNLVVACKACNIAKSNNDVLTRRLRGGAVLPSSPNDYKIVHPYFDVYSEHFEIILVGGRITHRPRNNHKARETFFMCDFLRFSYAFGEWDNFDYAIVSAFSDFVERCPKDATKAQIAMFMQTLVFTISADF